VEERRVSGGCGRERSRSKRRKVGSERREEEENELNEEGMVWRKK
jgi:hypothetical protein